MGTQETRYCLTSNCTKKTAHESGICHLHRKRRVNAKGEIEWCFPAKCYFKTDSERAKADFRLLPKAQKKRKSEPIKSFANLDKLLKLAPRPEDRNFNKINPQRAVQRPVVEPPGRGHKEVMISEAAIKSQNGFWRRMVQVFLGGVQ